MGGCGRCTGSGASRVSAPAIGALEAVGEDLPLLAALDVERLEERRRITAPDAENDAATRELVQHRDLFGRLQRVAQRQQIARGREADRARRRGDGGEEHEWLGNRRRTPEVALRQPEGFVAGALGETCLRREHIGATADRHLPGRATEMQWSRHARDGITPTAMTACAGPGWTRRR
jgi:hypothetical protein